MKLYQITEAYEAASRWIDENSEAIEAAGGEIPPELCAILDEIEDDFDVKVERVGIVIRQMEAHARVAGSEAERLKSLSASYQNGADSLKAYLLFNMQKVGKLKVDGDLVKVRVQKNSRPSIRPADPSSPPVRYSRVRMFGVCSPEAWRNISEACEVVGVGPPEHTVEFDSQAAYEALKAAKLLPEDPGVYSLDDLVIERGCHVRTQ
jgi:hypothetical protein